MRSTQDIFFQDLGLMDYQAAWDYQEKLLQDNVSIKSESYRNGAVASSGESLPTKHYLLFTEHPPVYTLGKSGNRENVLIDDAGMKEKKIAFFHTNRGGDITFHGPGQVVGYPIFDLEKFYTDIGRYLRDLEEVVIRLMAEYGLKGERSSGETGVWIDPAVPGRGRKICAIGVRSSRWVTMHGFALNVNTDLSYFNHIVPCGITDKTVTSLEKELGRPLPLGEVKSALRRHFAEVFNARILEIDQKSFAR
jgi:lipoyl(octanoyl) transferase